MTTEGNSAYTTVMTTTTVPWSTTHRSTIDGSEVRFLCPGLGGEAVFENENGDQFADDLVLWEPIAS